MTQRAPAVRLLASLVRTLRGLRRCLRLPRLARRDLEAMLQDAAAMGELETLAAQAGLPGVARALAVGMMGRSVRVQLQPAPADGGLVPMLRPPAR